jgi:hypothetical protein
VSNIWISGTVQSIHQVVYREDEKELTVEIEGGADGGDVDWLVHGETVTGWQPPHEQVPLTLEKKQEMMKNISKSLDLLGMKHMIVD